MRSSFGSRSAIEIDLVDLLLVLDDGELHLGVLEHVGHLVGHRVLIDGDGNAAEALHGGKGRVEARAVVADDGDRVAALEPELAQADGEGADLVAQLRPGPGLPDAEVLVRAWPGGRHARARCAAAAWAPYRTRSLRCCSPVPRGRGQFRSCVALSSQPPTSGGTDVPVFPVFYRCGKAGANAACRVSAIGVRAGGRCNH